MLSRGPECPPLEFNHIRGANYILYYDSSDPNWRPTTSSYVQWWLPANHPNLTNIWEPQMDGMKKLGINYLRVWLNFFAYEDLGRDTFIPLLQQLATKAQERCMVVEYVVWDQRFAPPDPSGHFLTWTSSPGPTLVEDPTFWQARGRAYVADVASSLVGYENVGFDVMNEPSFDSNTMNLVDWTATELRANNVAAEITIGFAGLNDNEDPTSAWYTPTNVIPHSAVTHYTVHPYSASQEAFDYWVDNALALIARRDPGKPLKRGEEVSVESLQGYLDSVIKGYRHALKTGREPLPWVFMQGVISEQCVFCRFNGMVYEDGNQIRDPEMFALQWVAMQQEPGLTLQPLPIKPASEPGYVPYHPVPPIQSWEMGAFNLAKLVVQDWRHIVAPLDDSNFMAPYGYTWRWTLIDALARDAAVLSFPGSTIYSAAEVSVVFDVLAELNQCNLANTANFPYLASRGWIETSATGGVTKVHWFNFDAMFQRQAELLSPILNTHLTGWF